MTKKAYVVCIDEIKQNLAFGDMFTDGYARTVKLSDGSLRTVTLKPVTRDGNESLELNDTGHLSFMGLHAATTNGNLMVQVHAIPDDLLARLEREGVF